MARDGVRNLYRNDKRSAVAPKLLGLVGSYLNAVGPDPITPLAGSHCRFIIVNEDEAFLVRQLALDEKEPTSVGSWLGEKLAGVIYIFVMF
jgi:hypothetical protein